MSGRIELEYGFTVPRGGPTPLESDPMKVLVLGDFSHSASSQKDKPLSECRIRTLDIDNLDSLLGQLAPTLDLQLDGGVKVSFSEMEDFHPDRLYQRLTVFDELRDIRKRLSDSQTFAQAAAQLRSMLQTAPGETPPKTADKEATAINEDDHSTFERLLGNPATTDQSSPHQHTRSAVERLIGEAIKDQIVAEATPEQHVYTTAAEDAAGTLMRKILQHPDFKALEALWRGLEFLVRRIELDENLQLFICDVSREELFNDLQQAGDDLEQSGLFQRLVTQGVLTPGNSPWSLIVGAYTFDASADDISTLAALGTISAQAGGTFLAAASPTILGCASLPDTPDPHDWEPDSQVSENWDALRKNRIAPWIGLALPRMLMRLPYGESTDEIEAFRFEEISTPGKVDELLWGNPAFACAQLIAQGFTERGWQM